MLGPDPTRSRADRSPDLVALLLACHARIRHFVALALRVATEDDAPVNEVAAACAMVRRYFTQALPLHVADEEESITPRLRGLSSEVDEALAAMASQHREHEPLLAAFLAAVEDAERDPRDEATKARLLERARALDAAFTEHLELEEAVVFPAIAGELSPETRAEIIAELRRRRGDA